MYDDALRERILGEAAAQLAAGGVSGLSLRRLATAAGTSTNAVYVMFGGKPQLVAEAVERALTEFSRRQAQAMSDIRSIDDLVALAHRYRAWARQHPALYHTWFNQIPFGLAGDHPGELPAVAESLAPVVGVVASLVEAGVLRPAAPEAIVRSLWGAVHGYVALEMGLRDWDDDAFSAHVDAVLRSWAA